MLETTDNGRGVFVSKDITFDEEQVPSGARYVGMFIVRRPVTNS